MSGRRPRVLVLADVPGWAWERKAQAYQRWLADRFDVAIHYQTAIPRRLEDFDLLHLFEVTQTAILEEWPATRRGFKAVAGLTAHVWQTWGEKRMETWAARVDALHGNSMLLYHELKQFHPLVYYTPNGVDPDFFRRWRPSPRAVIFGHVGKPNRRKGARLIVEAAHAAGAQLKLIQRTSKLAYAPQVMAAWYQGVSVMVTASNMDGTPNPMLEGAATECALLSTPIGNMPEFIKPGYNGFLTECVLPLVPGPASAPEPLSPARMAEVEAGEAALRHELAERMLWLKTHAEQTVEMGQAARQAVLADWTWQTQVQHVAKMWTEVLG